jgi:peptidoglycan lytic transglycosylase
MLFRTMIIAALVFSFVQQVFAADLYPLPDTKLATAARHLREKEFGAVSAVLVDAPKSGIGEFMLGMAAYRQQDWEHAAIHLAAGAEGFPLLADYALYGQALSLSRLAKRTDALPPLQRMARDFPDSPLMRSSRILAADILYDSGDYTNARTAYQKFIGIYPSGADSLTAVYKSALCLERLDDIPGSAAALRAIWLKYPASAIASKAEDDLRRLTAAGARVEPYSAAELMQRGLTLYDLRKYSQAAKAFQNLSAAQRPAGPSARYLLKGGQALFKARRYKEAAEQLSSLISRTTDTEVTDEARLWLGRAENRSGREEDAFATFMKLAETATTPVIADRAFLEASFIRKNQNRTNGALALLKKLLELHPDSPLKQGVIWEIAWESFQTGDMKSAADYFKRLTGTEATREKSLYWYGHSLATSGDAEGANSAFTALLTEFPYGFYAQSYRKEAKLPVDNIALPVRDMCEILPLPSGFERVKALITFGLYDEARRELAVAGRKATDKNGLVPGLARLYLEMSDYNGAYNLLRNARPRAMDKENLYQWGLCFPLAFREYVAGLAAHYSIPEGLVYAVIRAESSFSPTAHSPAGAVGLMQLMPATAAAVSGEGRGGAATSLTDPKINLSLGVKHLKGLLTLYDNDLVLAVAAYNAGAGNVNRWRKTFGAMKRNEFIESIPFAETREYVKKVISGAELYDRLYRLDGSSGPVVPTAEKQTAPGLEKPDRSKAEKTAS